MPKFLKNKKVQKSLKIIGSVLLAILVVYLIFAGRRYFTRRGIRQIQTLVKSYGTFSPLVILFLIFISNVIPPLPIPTPLVEMASGYIYGFLPSFFLVWISQIISSLAAYAIAKFIGKRVFKKILQNPVVIFYQKYLKEHGAAAVFITRTTMSSPFSIVSFLAGFTDIGFWRYAMATIFGTIIESALYSYVGSIIRVTRLRLWFVFIIVVVLGALGPIVTYAVMKLNIKQKKR